MRKVAQPAGALQLLVDGALTKQAVLHELLSQIFLIGNNYLAPKDAQVGVVLTSGADVTETVPVDVLVPYIIITVLESITHSSDTWFTNFTFSAQWLPGFQMY